MKNTRGFSRCFQHIALSLGASCLLTAGFAANAHAADYQNLPVVKPVMTCDQLAQADLSKITDAKITIRTATITDTPKGQYCRIVANVAPAITFHADFPIERWTQRFMFGSQGRYGDFTDHAEGCIPALNGEIVVATSGTGGGGGNGGGGTQGGANQPGYAAAAFPTIYTRPIYPFPDVAKYKGTGDVNDAANYEEVKGPLKTPEAFDNQTEKKLLGPNNQKFYKEENGNLVVVASK